MLASVDKENIGAIIVSFNGADTIEKTVRSVAGQVGRVVVVDNGSDQATISVLSAMAEDLDLYVLYLGANLGVGAALNRGVEILDDENIEWVLTLDQDSVPDFNMVNEFIVFNARNPYVEMMSPVIRGLDSNIHIDTTVLTAITSGHFIRRSVITAVGGYNEALFIDSVDFDFCLRAALNGKRTTKVKSAKMSHQLGEPFSNQIFLGRWYTNHKPLRRYYMARNHINLSRHYFFKFPIFILKLSAVHFIAFLAVAINGPHRYRSVVATSVGLIDGIRQQLGSSGRDF